MSLGVSFPHPGDVSGYGVSGVQGHPLSGVVPQDTEHGAELGDIALQGEQEECKMTLSTGLCCRDLSWHVCELQPPGMKWVCVRRPQNQLHVL